ncbi:PhoH-like ATPase [Gammaproteobacteria bacterium]
MRSSHPSGRRLFVLDTNVLMHDPAAIFRFHEHDIFLPMTVLEELDAGKKGLSEVARNARQASRFLDEIIAKAAGENIELGLPISTLPGNNPKLESSGRLFFQTRTLASDLPSTLPGNIPDNAILATVMAIRLEHPQTAVTLVSKDINLRIKARILGILAEDYYNDQVLDDVDLLYTGQIELPVDFWETHGKEMDSWREEGRTFYRITGPLTKDFYPNQCLFHGQDQEFEALARRTDARGAIIELLRDYRNPRNNIWGITARNREQNFALNLLMDPNIDFVTLVGQAGTGKTLLALAAGLAQTLDEKFFREIIMTRVTIPVGEDIGFLPGSEEEKMTPWMGALMDNLEVLTHSEANSEWRQAVNNDLLQYRIKIRSLNFMRGRTFLNRYLIIDEAQNLTAKQIKTLITRAGPGSKVVCLGNLNQIDTPYLTETNSGLTNVVDRFKNWAHGGHITLVRGERSRLADYASTVL